SSARARGCSTATGPTWGSPSCATRSTTPPGSPTSTAASSSWTRNTHPRPAAFLGGKSAPGWEFPGPINRSDWVQIAEPLKKRRPGLQVAEYPSNVVNDISVRADKAPYSDVRVRQAIRLALDRQTILDSTLEGVGAVNGPLPAALDDWALPIAQLGEGAKYYRHDPAEAKRLLAAAGYPNGFPASVCFATYGSTVLVDTVQLVL